MRSRMVLAALAVLTLARCGAHAEQKLEGTGGDAGTTDAAAGTGATSSASGFVGSCCAAQPRAGCGEILVAQCVCAKDPYCCKVAWDVSCALAVESSSCGQCQAGGAAGSGGSGGLTDGGLLGGFGGTDAGGPSGGTGALGGTGAAGGGAPACDPNSCPSFNAPPCCLSSSGPCGISTNQGTCVPNPCSQPATACQACLCASCAAETGKCTHYVGCAQIADCMLKSGCTGPGCYSPATCQVVLDQHGGPYGAERQVADSVVSCATLNSCSCP